MHRVGDGRINVPRLRRRIAAGAGIAAVALLATAAPAFAQDEPTAKSVQDGLTLLGTQVNLLWVVLGAGLVVFMQAGCALVETGFCRAKHAAHVVSTNFAIFGLGFVGFFFTGFAFAFGGFGSSLIGLEAPGKALIGSGSWVFLWKGGFAFAGIKPEMLAS